jgi:hypothetical protein
MQYYFETFQILQKVLSIDLNIIHEKCIFKNKFPYDLFLFTQFLGLVMMVVNCVFVNTPKH